MSQSKSVSGPHGIALPTLDFRADESIPPLGRQHPGPVLPRRVVAHVLLVAAGKLDDPVGLVVLVKSDDPDRHTP